MSLHRHHVGFALTISLFACGWAMEDGTVAQKGKGDDSSSSSASYPPNSPDEASFEPTVSAAGMMIATPGDADHSEYAVSHRDYVKEVLQNFPLNTLSETSDSEEYRPYWIGDIYGKHENDEFYYDFAIYPNNDHLGLYKCVKDALLEVGYMVKRRFGNGACKVVMQVENAGAHYAAKISYGESSTNWHKEELDKHEVEEEQLPGFVVKYNELVTPTFKGQPVIIEIQPCYKMLIELK